MTRRLSTSFTLIAAMLLIASVVVFRSTPLYAQDQRTNVTEPAFPAICSTLTASLSIVNGEPSSEPPFDTARIQSALTAAGSMSTCVGKAVELSASGGNYAFLIQPINIPSGITLLIDPGVTVFASRNPADYQVGTVGGNQQACGSLIPVTSSPNGCKPLITVNNGVASTGAGIMGYGVINGRGGDLLLINGVPGPLSWWGLTLSCYSPAGSDIAVNLQNNPMMIQPTYASNFTLYKTSIINGPYINVRFQGGNASTPTTGFTAWDVKVIDSATVPNTDGIDPVDYNTNMTVANSWISTGDDNMGIGSLQPGKPLTNLSIINHHNYAGDGISIGTGIDGGTSNILVNGLYSNGEPLTPAGGQAGIKLKSNSAVGGLVTNIVYQNVCLQNEPNTIYINSTEGGVAGTNYPTFGTPAAPIVFRNVTVLPDSATTSRLMLESYGPNNPSTLTFDNVNFTFTPNTSHSQYDNITLTGGPTTPAAVSGIAGTSIAITGTPTNPAEAPFACPASSFPPLIGELFLSSGTTTNQQTVSANYPATFNLNAVLEPATHESAALASPIISFYEGANLVGTGTLMGNGTYATLALSSIGGVTAGTHTYTASYTDANYGTYNFGSVTVTVNTLPTTNTLTLPTNQIPVGTYITLKSVVAVAGGTSNPTGALPTGTVTFLSNGTTVLGTATVNSATGIGYLTLNTLPIGTYSISASYTGSNFGSSVSAAQSLAVISPFVTVTASPTSLSIARGASGTSTLTITPSSGFTGIITVGCSSPVAYITCSVTPPAAGASTSTSTATIAVTSSYNSSLQDPGGRALTRRTVFAILLPLGSLLLFPLRKRRRSIFPMTVFFVIFSGLTLILNGCSNNNNGPAGNTQTPAGAQIVNLTTYAYGVTVTTPITVTIN